MSQAISRYPGASPFDRNQKELFFGREEEVLRLHRMVKLTPLTVVYGKSGYGKSSLLNAGLTPLLEDNQDNQCVFIRFFAKQDERHTDSPVQATISALQNAGTVTNHLKDVIAEEESFWRLSKEYNLAQQGNRGLVLIFDQFEELFTYSEEEILAFRQQLSEALYIPAPQRYWEALENAISNGQSPLDNQQTQIFQEEPKLKVVIAIRSDRLHLLNRLSDYIPFISKNVFEVQALAEDQARLAITEPAILKGDFLSPRYTYEEEALSRILDFLTDKGTAPIETTQLQIICHHLEQKISRTDAYEIVPADTNQLEVIIEDYYEDQINAIGDTDQAYAARRLIEEGLIFEQEERRLSIYEGQALDTYGLLPATLRLLVDNHLLRAESSAKGGYTYELSHDTLVPPILKAKEIRVAQEMALQRAEQERIQEELLQEERRKRFRTTILAGVFFLLFVLALAMAIWAVKQKQTTDSLRAEKLERGIIQAHDYQSRGDYGEAASLLAYVLKDANLNAEDKADYERKVDVWRATNQLLTSSEILSAQDSLTRAIELLTAAQELTKETDDYLLNKVNELSDKRSELVEKYLRSAQRQERLNPAQALRDYEYLLKLNHENEAFKAKVEQLRLNID